MENHQAWGRKSLTPSPFVLPDSLRILSELMISVVWGFPSGHILCPTSFSKFWFYCIVGEREGICYYPSHDSSTSRRSDYDSLIISDHASDSIAPITIHTAAEVKSMQFQDLWLTSKVYSISVHSSLLLISNSWTKMLPFFWYLFGRSYKWEHTATHRPTPRLVSNNIFYYDIRAVYTPCLKQSMQDYRKSNRRINLQ